jgi:tripartite-type tricarboxylate transporter receptor subunit TctC
VPTIAESGFTGFEADNWNGLFAPAKTPNETVSEFAGWFAAAMKVPDVKAKLVAQSLYPALMCGADFAALLSKQYNEFGRVIREANIKAN